MPKKTTIQKIATVNVIYIEGGDFMSIRSFKDNIKGNKHAEKTFLSLIKQHNDDLSKEDLEYHLDEGYFTDDNGTEYFLTHSDTDPELI